MKSIWKQWCLLGLPLALVFGVVGMLAQNGNPAYKPKRINRAVELLADKQPIYYTGSHTGARARKPVLNRARKMRRRSPTTSVTTWSTRLTTSSV